MTQAGAAAGTAAAPAADPGPAEPGPRRARARARAAALVRSEAWLIPVLAAGTVLRLLAMLGFRPILWFNDGFEYLGVALRLQAYPIRPDGYSVLLRALRPLHSFAAVAAVQHLLGIAVAVLLYALLRHWGVRACWAALAVAAPLLDVHQIELEHLLLSDTVFTALLVAALVALAWQSRVSPAAAAAAGAAMAAATLTRSAGLPLLVLGAVYLLVRWSGWRALLVYAVLALAPVAGYASWYHHEHGSYALSSSDGLFLYARTQTFADCAVSRPAGQAALLCDPRPVGQRGAGTDYLWHPSPLDNLPGPKGFAALPADRFSTLRNDVALRYSLTAIRAQPGAYLRTVGHDLARSFAWRRSPFPNQAVVDAYTFSTHPVPIPEHRSYVAGATARQDSTAYQHGRADTRLVAPYAGLMMGYQHGGYLPGPALAVLLLLGAAAPLAVRRRDPRRSGVALLWGAAVLLLVLPVLVVQFDYRYVLPAVPLAAAAAVLSVTVLAQRPGRAGPAGEAAAAPPAAAADPVARGRFARLAAWLRRRAGLSVSR